MKSKEYCLDYILKELLKNWGKSNNERDHLKSEVLLKEFGLPDVYQKHEFFKSLMNTLIKDGNAEIISGCMYEYDWQLERYQEGAIITLDGYYLIVNEGGYAKKKKKETNRVILQSLQTWAIVLGTLFAGVYAIYELWKEIPAFCH